MTHPYLKGQTPMTIKSYTCELLCEVAYFEDKTKAPSPKNRVSMQNPNRRSVGLPYVEIARLVKEKFPEAKTSPTAVRRIAGRIRADEPGYNEYLMPGRRPRAQSK